MITTHWISVQSKPFGIKSTSYKNHLREHAPTWWLLCLHALYAYYVWGVHVHVCAHSMTFNGIIASSKLSVVFQ